MQKLKYTAEFELKASPKMLFPYLSTASGLSQWFAQKVNIKPNKHFDIYWDNELHLAEQVSMKPNKSVKFEFLNTNNGDGNNYVEFKIEVSDLSGATFLVITDFSGTTDTEELKDLWEGFIDNLRETIGG